MSGCMCLPLLDAYSKIRKEGKNQGSERDGGTIETKEYFENNYVKP